MKKWISLILAVVLLLTFGLFAMGSGESSTDDQGSSSANADANKGNLSDCNIEIKSCRLATDYEGKKVVIVNYGYTNLSENATSFMTAVEAEVYQNGVGLNEAYILDESANYSSDNQTKEIKKDAALDVEVAYELNDEITEIEVEVTEWLSLDDKKVTKTFTITQ